MHELLASFVWVIALHNACKVYLQNGVQELRRISDYLGLQLSDDRLEEVLKRCTISNLKHDVESGKLKTPVVNKEGKSLLYREGTSV